MAPEILSTPEDVRTKEGESVRFHLRIFDEPEPKVEWYLNGQQLRKSKRFNLWFDGLYHLEINPGTVRTLLLMLYWYKIRYNGCETGAAVVSATGAAVVAATVTKTEHDCNFSSGMSQSSSVMLVTPVLKS